MTSNAQTARPGRTYFAPAARVMRLGPLRPGPEPGVEMTEIAPDLMRVEVTRVHHGASQYCITLNNWFDALPADRGDAANVIAQRESTVGGRPLWPRFKYNDFGILDFGDRLRIDMRYFPDEHPTEHIDATDAIARRWVPMIAGPISDMRFTFSESDGAQLTICGEDDLCALKTKNPTKIDYWARPEIEIIEDVLRRSGFRLPRAAPRCPLPAFTESEAKALAEAHFEGQSYLDYLMHFADRLDLEVYVEFADLDDPSSGLELHVECARSRVPVGETISDIYELTRGKNLVEFEPDLRVVDQYTSVGVTGRNRVSSSPTCVTGRAPPTPTSPDPLQDELHRDVERGDPPLVSGPQWRARKFGPNDHTEINQRGLDQERAAVMADALYRKRARKFLQIDAVTVGLPRLRAGQHAEIRGMRPPFDGFYYAEKTVHTLDEGGMRTRVHARRPGAPFPPYAETVN